MSIDQPKPKAKTPKQKKAELQEALPAAINILGRRFDIVVTSLKGLHGDCDIQRSIIRIHQNSSLDAARRTLFHEAVHAALGVSGHNEMLKEEQEEAIVRLLEHTFYDIVNVDKLAAE